MLMGMTDNACQNMFDFLEATSFDLNTEDPAILCF